MEVKFFFTDFNFHLHSSKKRVYCATKKEPLNIPVSGLGETENSAEEKNVRETLLFLTKSSIFDK